MIYYRGLGYTKIPSVNSLLYDKIKTQATNWGCDYDNSKGLGVTKNTNLVTNTWRTGFGYTSRSGSNDYLWTNSTAINLIKSGKPFMFSLARGAYFDHTVYVYSYRIYKNDRTGISYTF